MSKYEIIILWVIFGVAMLMAVSIGIGIAVYAIQQL